MAAKHPSPTENSSETFLLHQKTLVHNLMVPGVLAAEGIESMLETHLSWVLLSRDFAYKFKKAVKFDFLDFTSLANRKFYCYEELRLNKRLAKELYLEVVEIFGSSAHPSLKQSGLAVEYGVKMKRFPAEMELSRLIETRPPDANTFNELATGIAIFHKQAARANPADGYASETGIYHRVIGNFNEIDSKQTTPVQRRRLKILRRWTSATFQKLVHVFSDRIENSKVRECHGDLHLGNLVMINGRIIPFDCLEFNADFRWIDTCSEIAFLMMDLVASDHSDIAHVVLNRYLEISDDYEMLVLLRFYMVYRAMVRAKVSLLMTQENNKTPGFLKYLGTAESIARESPRPHLVITMGLSGSGKSWLCRKLSAHWCVIHIRSDVIRKHLHDMNMDESAETGMNSGIYSEQATSNVYGSMADKAKIILGAGYPVLVDATFLKKQQRSLLYNASKQAGATFTILNIWAPEPVLSKRIIQRRKSGSDPSDADLTVLAHQIENQEPLSDNEKTHEIQVDSREYWSDDKCLDLLHRLKNREQN